MFWNKNLAGESNTAFSNMPRICKLSTTRPEINNFAPLNNAFKLRTSKLEIIVVDHQQYEIDSITYSVQVTFKFFKKFTFNFTCPKK